MIHVSLNSFAVIERESNFWDNFNDFRSHNSIEGNFFSVCAVLVGTFNSDEFITLYRAMFLDIELKVRDAGIFFLHHVAPQGNGYIIFLLQDIQSGWLRISIDRGGPKSVVGFWGQYQDFHISFGSKSIISTWVFQECPECGHLEISFWALLKW